MDQNADVFLSGKSQQRQVNDMFDAGLMTRYLVDTRTYIRNRCNYVCLGSLSKMPGDNHAPLSAQPALRFNWVKTTVQITNSIKRYVYFLKQTIELLKDQQCFNTSKEMLHQKIGVIDERIKQLYSTTKEFRQDLKWIVRNNDAEKAKPTPREVRKRKLRGLSVLKPDSHDTLTNDDISSVHQSGVEQVLPQLEDKLTPIIGVKVESDNESIYSRQTVKITKSDVGGVVGSEEIKAGSLSLLIDDEGRRRSLSPNNAEQTGSPSLTSTNRKTGSGVLTNQDEGRRDTQSPLFGAKAYALLNAMTATSSELSRDLSSLSSCSDSDDGRKPEGNIKTVIDPISKQCDVSLEIDRELNRALDIVSLEKLKRRRSCTSSSHAHTYIRARLLNLPESLSPSRSPSPWRSASPSRPSLLLELEPLQFSDDFLVSEPESDHKEAAGKLSDTSDEEPAVEVDFKEEQIVEDLAIKEETEKKIVRQKRRNTESDSCGKSDDSEETEVNHVTTKAAGRRNIPMLLTDEKLTSTTREANLREKERLERLKQKQKKTRHNVNVIGNNHGTFRDRGAYIGNNRGRGNMRPQNIQNRNIQQKRLQAGGDKKCFLNPPFKGNIKSNTWGNKPVILIQPWADNPPPPINNFQQPPPLVPSLPPVVVHNQQFQYMRQIPPPIQEIPPKIHQRLPVHQRLGFKQLNQVNTYVPPCPSYHQLQGKVTEKIFAPTNQMMPPPNHHMNNPLLNNPPMMFNQQPIYNQPRPLNYQPNTYTPPQNYNNYQQYNSYQSPPSHHQVSLYNQANEHNPSYEQQQQINNHPVETNYNSKIQRSNLWDNNVDDHSYIPSQSHNVMHRQGYDHNQSVQIFHKNRKFSNKQKRCYKRSDGYEDNITFNKRRSFENKELQRVPLVDKLTHVNVTGTGRQPEVEEDEETKRYRKHIEEQKKLRERILAKKDRLRKLAAQKKTLLSF